MRNDSKTAVAAREYAYACGDLMIAIERSRDGQDACERLERARDDMDEAGAKYRALVSDGVAPCTWGGAVVLNMFGPMIRKNRVIAPPIVVTRAGSNTLCRAPLSIHGAVTPGFSMDLIST